MAAPVRTGEELELRVDSLAFGGNGVARLNGFVVFVRRGLPGDTVRARVTKVKRGFAEAIAEEVLQSSEDRVAAPCPHFPPCGGCRFQDLAYERQAAAKESQVRDALRRIARISEPPLEPLVPAVSLFGYRNKLEYSFTHTDDGPALGFHRAGRWDEVLPIGVCLLTTPLGNAIRDAVRDWARQERLDAYDQNTQSGYLRHLVVREGRNTGQVLVQLVTAAGERFDADYLIEVLTTFPQVRSIHWAVNDTPAEITNLPTRLLWGDEAIEEELLGLRFRLRPNAFLQTNTAMAERLYALALEAAGLTGSETVYDLYCGTGTIGLCLAGQAGSVWGVEISEEAVACAIENASLNGVRNASFFAGNVSLALEELRERAGAPDVVVVDPPRAGLAGKALRRLARLGAPRIVYVSCNPTTLSGDLKTLREDWGYELRRCTPLDMFPHTPHIESVSLLER
ncbi:MAG TPA: 23S rRNA (uracil(1939)-C(5))-methyltransferase RlmD [Gaiellaceae bacterium]|nr:23S rRNA (uracil(1939)-C(5))-methyltransferase RlmD [Gaiellaceae bacterium]